MLYEVITWSLNGLVKHFGKAGHFFYYISRGIDDRPVKPNQVRKSVGIENTFQVDLTTDIERSAELDILIDGLWKRLEKSKKHGRTLTIVITSYSIHYTKLYELCHL